MRFLDRQVPECCPVSHSPKSEARHSWTILLLSSMQGRLERAVHVITTIFLFIVNRCYPECRPITNASWPSAASTFFGKVELRNNPQNKGTRTRLSKPRGLLTRSLALPYIIIPAVMNSVPGLNIHGGMHNSAQTMKHGISPHLQTVHLTPRGTGVEGSYLG